MHFRSSYTQPDLGEEHEPILSPPRRKTSKLGRNLGRGILINRFILVVVLAGVTVAGWYFQHTMVDLRNNLQSEQSKVDALEAQLKIHAQVIERFNDSVTNTDVMNRLSTLETKFQQTQLELHTELETTQQSITKQLHETLQELSTTVDQAEAEISQEVEKVKKDVEQYVVTTQDQFSMENSFMVYQLAGTFTVLSCLISMWHMTAHMRKMNEPDVQRKILAILWMSPLYAVTSWFSLVFHSAEGYLAIIKDGYEAYIIYQFLSFCIAVLGKGDRNKVVDLLANHADHLTPPFRLFGCCEYMCGCCKPEPYENNRALADAILLQCQVFAMQFVLFRPLTTTIMVVLQQLNYYGAGDGPTDYRSPQFYVTIVQNLSIFIAFTGLLKFYHAVDKDLAWCRPFAKFLCIKGVVFMTFWQGLAISILAQTTDVGGQDEQEWAQSAQNFLICLEMLLFSIAHFYCFPTDEWQEGYRVKHEQGRFGDTIALGDFFQDVKLILQSKPSKKKKRHHHGTSPPKLSSKLVASSRDEVKNENTENINQNGALKDDSGETFLDDEENGIERTMSGGTGASESGGDATNSSFNEKEYSFQESAEPREANEIDTTGDEETGLLSRNLDGLSEEDRRLALALEKSLGLAADDPDIADAARRLLDSKVLSPEFFQSILSEDYVSQSESYVDMDDEDEEVSYEQGSEGSMYGSTGVGQIQTAQSHNSEAISEPLETPRSQIIAAQPDFYSTPSGETAVDEIPHGESNQTDGSFWAFDSNVNTPEDSPAPHPPANEGTPLLQRKVASLSGDESPSSAKKSPPEESGSSSTPLRSSIFTRVAALAEEKDGSELHEKDNDIS